MTEYKYIQIGMIVDKSNAKISLYNESLPPKQYYSEYRPLKKTETTTKSKENEKGA